MGFAVERCCTVSCSRLYLCTRQYESCAYCEAVKRKQRAVTGARTCVMFGNSTTHVPVLRLDRASLVVFGWDLFTTRPSFGTLLQ